MYADLHIKLMGGMVVAMQSEAPKTKDKADKLPIGRFFAFRAGYFSLAANFIVIGFLMIYCTDTLGMPSALVGSLIFASKIFDAFAELYAGYVVDRTKSKLGKGRPWDLCLIGVWVSTILLFATPAGASMTVKSIWVFLFYTLVQTVFQTLVQAGTAPYLLRAFRNKNVMVKVQSYGGVVGMVLSIALSVIMPSAISNVATSPGGWTKVIAIVSTVMLVLGLLRFLLVKEQYNTEMYDSQGKAGIRDILQSLGSNKYIWYVTGISFLIQLISGMNAATYYFTYVVGDLAQMSVIQPLSMVLLPLMFIFPMLIKKFSMSAIIAVGSIGAIIGNIIIFAANASIPLLIVGSVFTALGMLGPPYLTVIMILDCAKYNALTGKKPMEASMMAVTSFGANIGQGFGTAALGFILAWGGYAAGEAVQSAGAIWSIRILYSLVPGAMYILMFLFARLFNLEKVLPELEKANAASGEA
jgi:Na+/melibiose symporter-like transporter